MNTIQCRGGVDPRRSFLLCILAVILLQAEAFNTNRHFTPSMPMVTIPSRVSQTKYLNIQSRSSSLLPAKNDVCVDVVSTFQNFFIDLNEILHLLITKQTFSVHYSLQRIQMKIGQEQD